MSTLVERIQSRLDITGKNATSVADEIGANRSLVRDILVGKSKNPGIDTIRALCRPLECSLAYLVGIERDDEKQEEPQLGRFWMVHGLGQGVPRFVHHSEDSARQEARRLAGVYPQVTFVVLESTTAYRSEAPAITQFEIVEPSRFPDDDIPF